MGALANTSDPGVVSGEEFDIDVTAPSSGKMWSTNLVLRDSDDNALWTNTLALDELGSVFGDNAYDRSAFETGGTTTLKYTYSGGQYTTTDAVLTLSGNYYNVTDKVVIYALVTSQDTTLGNFSITSGLKDITYTYATETGTGFSNAATWSQGAGHLTIVKVEGELTALNLTLDSTTAKNGWAGIGVAAIPEPSAFGLLAGLGALALVASRRRRK